jgi:hypothetical protein
MPKNIRGISSSGGDGTFPSLLVNSFAAKINSAPNNFVVYNTSSSNPLFKINGQDLSATFYCDLNVLGNVTFTTVSNIDVNSSMISLAIGNTTNNLLDIGFYGIYNSGGIKHKGLINNVNLDRWILFKNIEDEPNNTITLTGNYLDSLEVNDLYFGGQGETLSALYNSFNLLATDLSDLDNNIIAKLINISNHITNSNDDNATYMETSRVRVDATDANAFTVGQNANGDNVLNVNTETKLVSINGSLDITGTLTFNEYKSTDETLLRVGNNNSADLLDLGFIAEYTSGTQKFAAFYRDASDSGIWKLVENISTEPLTLVSDTSTWSTFKTGTVVCVDELKSPDANITNLLSLNQIVLDNEITITRSELEQISKINNTTISDANWLNLSYLDQSVGFASTPTFTSVTSSNGYFSTIVNVGNPAATSGEVNSGPAGIYSYNTMSRYMRFNTNGGANDFLSAGSPMVINYSGGDPGMRPEDIELFGYYASSPSTFYVNGKIAIGGGMFETVTCPVRELTIRAGSSQDTANLFSIRTNSDADLVNVSLINFSTNYGTSASGSVHINLANSNLPRFSMGLKIEETGSNAGSNFGLFTYDDAGIYLGNPVTIKRSNAAVNFAGALRILTTDNDEGNITSGTYTPSISNITSLDTVTVVGSFKYQRIGSIINVSGKIFIENASAIGSGASYDLSLPYIVNNFSSTTQCNGIGISYAGSIGNWEISSVNSSQLARAYANIAFASNTTYAAISFTYQIV